MAFDLVLASITYDALMAAIGGSTLVPGQQYIITDYATTHYIVDGNGNQYLDTIVVGPTEPLIVIAVSTSALGSEARSTLNPEDVIHYDPTPANWLDDLSFADLSGSPVIVTGFKGVITFRHDTLLDNYFYYDFRYCQFRRWKTAAPAWLIGTTFANGDYTTYSGKVYRALAGSNTGNQPDSSPAFWVALLDLALTEYYNAAPYIWNGIPSDTVFADFKTFAEGTGTATYLRCCRANHFEGFKDDHTDRDISATLLSNNVFFLQDNNYYQVYSNNIRPENYSNTVAGYFSGNFIGSYFVNNTIGASFYNNSVGDGFYGNSIWANFNTNTIGARFNNNSVGDGFASNSVGDNFQANSIEDTAGTGIDFTGATHVYAAYNTTIQLKQDGTARLSYMDNSDVLVVVAPTA